MDNAKDIYHDIGTIKEIPVGSFMIVTLGGREVGVTRLPSGEIRAIRNYCPHKAAPICRGVIGGTWPPSEPGELEFDLAGQVLVCPWHGFEYDMNTGKELFREIPTRLAMYDVMIRDSRVLVNLARRYSAD